MAFVVATAFTADIAVGDYVAGRKVLAFFDILCALALASISMKSIRVAMQQ